MAGTSLLALIDDIATVLDDVAILSKVAAKKTVGVLGDDLALNAEQVTGVKADRELPVVWAVAKGSFINKLILVPTALLISAFYPPLITVLMICGGLFLCYEGAEKITHKLLHSKDELAQQHLHKLQQLADSSVDLIALEKKKISGAIKTDFVLSAEIIVLVLGSVQTAVFETQVFVLSGLAIAFTIGVYGFVAAIVKVDDFGLYLLRKSVSGKFNTIQRTCGRALLIFAPLLMKSLTIIGTIAMFLVGGGIVVHNINWLHHQTDAMVLWSAENFGAYSQTVLPLILEGVVGLAVGLFVFAVIVGYQKLTSKTI